MDQNTINHCATCGHYREWHSCLAGEVLREGGLSACAISKPAKAADIACELYTTERASDLTYEDYVYPRWWRPGSFA